MILVITVDVWNTSTVVFIRYVLISQSILRRKFRSVTFSASKTIEHSKEDWVGEVDQGMWVANELALEGE